MRIRHDLPIVPMKDNGSPRLLLVQPDRRVLPCQRKRADNEQGAALSFAQGVIHRRDWLQRLRSRMRAVGWNEGDPACFATLNVFEACTSWRRR